MISTDYGFCRLLSLQSLQTLEADKRISYQNNASLLALYYVTLIATLIRPCKLERDTKWGIAILHSSKHRQHCAISGVAYDSGVWGNHTVVKRKMFGREKLPSLTRSQLSKAVTPGLPSSPFSPLAPDMPGTPGNPWEQFPSHSSCVIHIETCIHV